jgi:UDP-N-acetyl-D-glucosamine dehydrogenase
MNLLLEKGAEISFHDPYVKELEAYNKHVKRVDLDKKTLEEADCVIIITDHSVYDYSFIVEHAKIVIDTRNATKNIKANREKIVTL